MIARVIERGVPRKTETRLVYSTEGPLPSPEASPKHDRTPAGARGITLRLERRKSQRLVTVVGGLPGTASEVAALARELRSSCGAGGTVKDRTVEIQGDQRSRVESVLAARGLRWKRAGEDRRRGR